MSAGKANQNILQLLCNGEYPHLVIFSLGGTLVNVMPGLTGAVNVMLHELEWPPCQWDASPNGWAMAP